MRLKPIRSEINYDMALETIERYFNKPPKKGTAEADRFDVLAKLIEETSGAAISIGRASTGMRRTYALLSDSSTAESLRHCR